MQYYICAGTASRVCTDGGFIRGSVWEAVNVSECETDLESVMAEVCSRASMVVNSYNYDIVFLLAACACPKNLLGSVS